MKKSTLTAVATAAIFSLTLSPIESFAAKKNKRDSMSDAQKKELRKSAREYCQEQYAKGTTCLERVEIKSDGRVICWMRG